VAVAAARAPGTEVGDELLVVRDLVKHFPIRKGLLQREVARVHAVDGISFDVRHGETFGLVGESGCGKSTTARLITRLLTPTSGTISYDGHDISQWPERRLRPLRRDVQMIFSHGGGTLPFLTERFVRLPLINKSLAARVPNGVEAELKRFYYDTAQAAHPYALASLTKLIPVSQIVFGTDFPYRTAIDHVKGLTDYGFGASDLQAIDRDNAVRLMPRLKA